MPFIEDGTGTSRRAKVDANFRLQTYATSTSEESYASQVLASNVLLTHHRYYYVQITNADASNLYVKITRRNY